MEGKKILGQLMGKESLLLMSYWFKSYERIEKCWSIKAFHGIEIVTFNVQITRKEEKGRSNNAFYGEGIVTFLVILLQIIRKDRKVQVN